MKVVRLPENRGIGPALAVGVESCRNNLIARMDSDDIACPERCEKAAGAVPWQPGAGAGERSDCRV